jgi:hypothetical protein
MYNPESTPALADADPLDVEVFVGVGYSPSPCLDVDLNRRLSTAAQSCGVAAPTPELIKLFAMAGAQICEKVSSVEQADGELASCICWLAVQRDNKTNGAVKWFDGRWWDASETFHLFWIRAGQSGYLGRLARVIREALYESPEFARFIAARQRLAERIETMRRDRQQLATPVPKLKSGAIAAFEVGVHTEPRLAAPAAPPPAATEPLIASVPGFPKRAEWLKDRLAERGWNKHDLQKGGGPEHRTTQKILDGFDVQEDVLRRVIAGLKSKPTHRSRTLPAVVESDIPTD